jgi:hypothetical protein
MVRTGLVTLATLIFTTTSAFAATVPTLSRGMRGQDVALMQRLLTHNGEPVAITELLGPTTEGLVKRFQWTHGLVADGLVGNATWRALAPRLQQGASGVAVTALQQALNAKHQSGLAVDGRFGSATARAVRAFQAHQGLPVTGVADDATWLGLIAHFEEMPWSGTGFYRYSTINPDGAWGRSNAVGTMKEVARQWAAEGYSARIGIGDISLPHGGQIPDHASHQKGVDMDIAVMRSDGREVPRTSYRHSAYSRQVTRRLVDMLLATGEVEVIFFNDPYVRGVTPWPNHDSHLHVRFRR